MTAHFSEKNTDFAEEKRDLSDEKYPLVKYLDEVGKLSPLALEDELKLVTVKQFGTEAEWKEARERLILSNLLFVVSVAKKYQGMGLTLLELINEGNIGLAKAVDRFQPRGVRLCSYARHWIKQRIVLALGNQSRTVRIPIYQLAKRSRMNRVFNELYDKFGRCPSNLEIAARLGVTEEDVEKIRSTYLNQVSLSAPVGDEDSSSFLEIIPDTDALDPSRVLEKRGETDLLSQLMKTLSAKEADILTARYGLAGEKPQSLDEVGKRLCVSKQRVQQIESKAIKKLVKRARAADVLSEFYL